MTNVALEKLVYKGSQRLSSGDLNEASKYFRRALSISPRDAQASHLLGITLVRLGKLVESLPLFETAVAAEPGNKEYFYSLGVAQRWRGLNHDAEGVFRSLLAIDSNDFVGLCNLGELLANRDEYMESIALLKTATALRPREAAELRAPGVISNYPTSNYSDKLNPTPPQSQTQLQFQTPKKREPRTRRGSPRSRPDPVKGAAEINRR